MSSFGRGSDSGYAGRGGGGRYNRGRGRGRGWRGGGGRGGGRGQGRRGRGGRQGDGYPVNNNDSRDDSNDTIEELGLASENSVCIAVEGCCHGQLDAIYDRLERHQEKAGRKIDLLLCCGDFQSLRNMADFHSLAVPPKYRALETFYQYYSGEKVAPILTVFVGGNHEASQPLQELYYGGWVAPRIYYMGAAGVISFRGLRIGGISGIYKPFDYELGRFEKPPYDQSTLRSVYHVRNVDVYRLECYAKAVTALRPDDSCIDVMMSHDWPQGIDKHGDTEGLLRRKPFLRQEAESNCLGSPPNNRLLSVLRPKWWFAAHLHVKFKATFKHMKAAENVDQPKRPPTLVPSQVLKKSAGTSPIDNQSIDEAEESTTRLSITESDALATEFLALPSNKSCSGPDLTDLMTQFLSLDKCLPRRHCLAIIHIQPSSSSNQQVDVYESIETGDGIPGELSYDPVWLAVLRKTHHLSTKLIRRVKAPSEILTVTPEEIKQTEELLGSTLAIDPGWFEPTVPAHLGPPVPLPKILPPPFNEMGNPQTDRLLSRLHLEHRITVPFCNKMSPAFDQASAQQRALVDENEIRLEEEEEGQVPGNRDDNEIDLDETADLNVELESGLEGSVPERRLNTGSNADQIGLDSENGHNNSILGDADVLLPESGALERIKRPRLGDADTAIA